MIFLIWLITHNSQDSKTLSFLNIMKQGFIPCLVLSTFIFPQASQAWLFSSVSAQEPLSEQGFSLENAQTMDLLTPAIAMNFNLKPDDGIDIVLQDDGAMTPEIGPLGTLADVYDIPVSDEIIVYKVSPGDTVVAVAKRFGVSESTIRWANNLKKTDVLHVGQTLTILPISGVKHIVTKGDTLVTIAKRYKADAQDIADYNGIESSDALVIGQVVIVPDGQIPVTAGAAQSKSSSKTIKNRANIPETKSVVSASKGYYKRPIVLDGNPRIRKTQGFHDRYNAVDIGAPIGTPIHAMASGTVIIAKGPTCSSTSPTYWNGGYGNLTIIQHSNGTQTLYAHQKCLNVSVGDTVSQGEIIGQVGNTGRSTGPHLHFEIRGIRPTPVLY